MCVLVLYYMCVVMMVLYCTYYYVCLSIILHDGVILYILLCVSYEMFSVVEKPVEVNLDEVPDEEAEERAAIAKEKKRIDTIRLVNNGGHDLVICFT